MLNDNLRVNKRLPSFLDVELDWFDLENVVIELIVLVLFHELMVLSRQ